jgi:hypothetical protein
MLFRSPRRYCWPLAVFLITAVLGNNTFAVDSEEFRAERERFFQNSVLPILQRRCYECHSHAAGQAKGGLMLDSREGWDTGGDSGPAVIPSSPDTSLLIQAVRYDDLMMPPTGKLPADEIEILVRWVNEGAVDPRQSAAPKSATSTDPNAGRDHWAFQPVQQTAVPNVQDAAWPLTEIDAHILAALEQHQLKPVADADRYTWLRRVSLDLTGLPPSPAEIQSFVSDESPQAWSRVVDRLLDSSAFGERWARHWLDLVGYADQIGTANNIFAEHAWRYRDYVIRSFNDDKPFSQFLREQLAGDLLPSTSPEHKAELLVATGYLLLGDVQVVEADKAKLRVDVIDQQIDKLGKSLLGMTLACARCHDHKFDPISQNDYYALGGMFYSTESVTLAKWGVWSWPSVTEIPETSDQLSSRTMLRSEQEARLATMRSERDAAHRRAVELEKLTATPSGTSTADSASTAPATDNTAPVDTAAMDALQQELKALREKVPKFDKEILHTEFFLPAAPQAFAVRDTSTPGDMHVTIRGNAHAIGDLVPRGIPSVLADSGQLQIPAGQSGRLQLADWIISPHNPLTARVTVNRIWQKLFGKGLVRSVDYWGTRGETPTHPALLDLLARIFVEQGWSQKQLIRQLVLSHVYRLSSNSDSAMAAADPENRLLWRMNRERLDAESIRDSMLAVSGRLLPSGGGPSLPLEYVENTGGLAKGDVNPPSFRLAKFRPQQSFERTVYLPVIRSAPQAGPGEIRNVFDFAQPAEFTGQRSVTAVPTQSLFLMNGALVKELAAALAQRMLTEHPGPTDADKVDALWLVTFNRPITDGDRTDALQFLKDMMAEAPDNSVPTDTLRLRAWTELCHSLLASNEFLLRM